MGKNEGQGCKIKKSVNKEGSAARQDHHCRWRRACSTAGQKPVKSLGRLYTADLSDRQMGKLAKQQLAEGLAKIEQSHLPGKYKVWCYQHTLYHRVMWPLKICEIPSSEVSRMDSLANNYIRKWLGLPRCLSDAGLFGWNMLELPMKSISLGYKQEKACLVLELKDSADQLIKSAKVPIRTGCKWKAQAEVDHAISSLQHREVMGSVQTSRAGLGWGAPQQFWSKVEVDLFIGRPINRADYLTFFHNRHRPMPEHIKPIIKQAHLRAAQCCCCCGTRVTPPLVCQSNCRSAGRNR